MGRDGEDRDFSGGGAVAPEDAVGAGSAVLGVGLEDLLAGNERMRERAELVGVEPRAPRVLCQQGDALVDLLEQALVALLQRHGVTEDLQTVADFREQLEAIRIRLRR